MTTVANGISVSQAAERLGTRVDEVYRLLRSKRLRASKVAGKWVIDPLSLRRRVRDGE